ncbi:MAG TPA: hypothetical protein VIL86_04415, partial [Tepidisphaeraceae bacterium]
TAWITSTRSDRFTSQQNIVNSQVDLLVEGVRNMAAGLMADGLFDTTSTYRPDTNSANTATVTYLPYTSGKTDPLDPADFTKLQPNDAWLAVRIPVAANGKYYWSSISYPLPLLKNSRGPAVAIAFDRPDSTTQAVVTASANGTKQTKDQCFWQIGSMTVGSSVYPTLTQVDQAGTILAGPFLAADTDGDGIGDAGYFKLPVKDINGLTWYAAVRIIDNNSALNANIAFSRDIDTGAPNNTNYGFFRAGVGLQESLIDPLEMAKLLSYRCGGIAGASTTPIGDNALVRGDFVFFSQGDALEMQLARRLLYPGYNTTVKYQAMGMSESAAMAYRFCLVNSSANLSVLEQNITKSVYNSAGSTALPSYSSKPYLASDAATWFTTNFNYPLDGSNTLPLRALLTARTPVSNLIQVKSTTAAPTYTPLVATAAAGEAMAAYSTTPCKTPINTATFNELWRAYWSVMTDAPYVASGQPKNLVIDDVTSDAVNNPYQGSAFTAPGPTYLTAADFPAKANETHPGSMWRNSLRDPRSAGGAPNNPSMRLPALEMLKLRAAIAAINAIDLRKNNYNVTSKMIRLTAKDGTTLLNATVYGSAPQPYITEIYAQTDTTTVPATIPGATANTAGYVAVELYNPYPFDMDLTGFQLAMIARPAAAAYPLTMTPLATFNAATLLSNSVSVPPLTSTTIKAGGYLVLESYNAAAPLVGYRPPSSGLPGSGPITTPAANSNYAYCPLLTNALNNELVLLRPATGALMVGNVLTFTATVGATVPVDSFDFTGLIAGAAVPPAVWHYARANDPATKAWHFIYPGRYDAMKTTEPVAPSPPQPRQQGTQNVTFTAVAGDPWDPLNPTPAPPTPAPTLGTVNVAASYANEFAIQIANVDFAGFNRVGAVTPNKFPFGGFARNGDMLEIPYIGAYTISRPGDAATQVVEVNPVTMDSIFAEDTDQTDDKDAAGNIVEQVGRFCPITLSGAPNIDDLFSNGIYSGTLAAGQVNWRYHWATHLFDYLTVQSPNDDYFPNVPRDESGATAYTPAPAAVANDPSTAATPNAGKEDTQPVDGLININTASWKVFSMLPLAYSNTNKENEQLAQAIVYFRDVDNGTGKPNGPFKSIFELNKVYDVKNNAPANSFQNGWGTLNAFVNGTEDDAQGDVSPWNPTAPVAGPTVDGVPLDFELRFLTLNRISNMITTRSDSFTCYVVVEGWRNAGSTDPAKPPARVVQRRSAYILDRSGVTATNKTVKVTNVPQD